MHRDDDQRLEQGVGDELDQDDLPIRGRHQGAALEGELQQSSHSTMTKRMTLPPFVTRAVARLAAGGLVAAAAIAIAAVVIERTQLGGDLETSRARLKAEVEGEFAALTNRLDTAVRAVPLDPEVLRLADQGDQAARRRLFEQVIAAAESPNVALAVYGGTNEPVAWTGRSEESRRSPDRTGVALPRTKHPGPAAGPRPARARSGRSGAPHRRASSRRRRCPVPGAPRSPARSSRSRPASCRWPCGCQFEGGAETDPGAFIIRSPSDEPLVAVTVSDADLAAARQRIRDRLLAAELTLAALLLLLFTGALLDWRRSTRIGAHRRTGDARHCPAAAHRARDSLDCGAQGRARRAVVAGVGVPGRRSRPSGSPRRSISS